MVNIETSGMQSWGHGPDVPIRMGAGLITRPWGEGGISNTLELRLGMVYYRVAMVNAQQIRDLIESLSSVAVLIEQQKP